MTPFTQSQRIKALFWLSLFHLLVIISSNYLVQLPITIFGFHTTRARLVFLYFSCHRSYRAYFGAPLARRIIFAVMIPALLVSYVVSSLCSIWARQGFAALANFNLFVARIAAASFMAYALGQILMSMCLTACAKIVAGGWRRPLQRCLAISAIPLPFLHCVLAKPRCLYGRALDGNCAGGLLL